MKDLTLLSDDQLRQILLESAGIIDSLFQQLQRKDTMLLQQQDTIDELTKKVERYNGILFAEPEKPEGSN